MSQPTQAQVDRATSTIRFERVFDASPEEVFEAWTDPEQIRLWWDPSGQPLVDCKVDLRPGGAFVFTNGSGHAPPFAGTYLEIARPSLLVFDAMNARGTVQLSSAEGKTRMVVSIRCSSPEHLAQLLQLGVDVGTAQTLDNLVAQVAKRG
jgi:uncharacterized protein YndB with AHSA1/START domain